MISFLILGQLQVEAQFRQNDPYNRQSTVPNSSGPAPTEEKPLTAAEIVAKEMPQITEVVGLNPFEEAVVSTILTKYVQKSIELRILELKPEKMTEAMEKIREDQNEELKQGLPEEKYNLLMELKEEGMRKMKKKKKKKKKKE